MAGVQNLDFLSPKGEIFQLLEAMSGRYSALLALKSIHCLFCENLVSSTIIDLFCRFFVSDNLFFNILNFFWLCRSDISTTPQIPSANNSSSRISRGQNTSLTPVSAFESWLRSACNHWETLHPKRQRRRDQIRNWDQFTLLQIPSPVWCQAPSIVSGADNAQLQHLSLLQNGRNST